MTPQEQYGKNKMHLRISKKPLYFEGEKVLGESFTTACGTYAHMTINTTRDTSKVTCKRCQKYKQT